MKRKLIVLICIITVIVISVLLLKPKKEESTTYKDVSVSTQTITNTITSTGEVTSETTTKYLNTNRYFKTIYYEVGDYIKKGSKIIKYTNGTYLKAPCDLVLTSYSVPDSKEKVRSNNFIEYKPMSSLKITINIDESDINKVKEGTSVTITLNYDETKTYEGTLSNINYIGNYSSSGTSYTGEVTFKNDGNVKLGMSGTASIEIEKAENVIAVPIEAIQSRGNEKYVLVVGSDNETSEAIVETGVSNSAYVEIKSGLNGDETIRMVSTDTDSSNKMNRNFDFKDMDMERPNGDRPSDRRKDQ